MVFIPNSKNLYHRKRVKQILLESLPDDLLKEAKRNGFSDEQIAKILNGNYTEMKCTKNENR
jgi:predicted metal-dependent phosphotriesterase family hydrolase